MHMNIKDIVKNNAARFSLYRAGHMYYKVVVDPNGIGSRLA